MEFACEIHTTRTKRLGSFVGRENCLGKCRKKTCLREGLTKWIAHGMYIGRIQVHLSDLPSGQEDDRWHQLMLGSARTARGSVRFGALFKDYIILPVKEYAQLKEVWFVCVCVCVCVNG